VRGELVFDHVTFAYHVDERGLLADVKRYGMESVGAALSGGKGNGHPPTPAGARGGRDACPGQPGARDRS
jgi:hypothetical protein